MRTIKQAEKYCYAAWAAEPEATHGWCVHHGQEFEELNEPIANRIKYIIFSKGCDEQVCRLDNMRPVSAASLAIVLPAKKTYDEAVAPAKKTYDEAVASAEKTYYEAVAPAEETYDEAVASAEETYYEAVAPA